MASEEDEHARRQQLILRQPLALFFGRDQPLQNVIGGSPAARLHQPPEIFSQAARRLIAAPLEVLVRDAQVVEVLPDRGRPGAEAIAVLGPNPEPLADD